MGSLFKERKFKASEVEINYTVGPKNGPPLLLLHGLSANWEVHKLYIPFLINYWQIYAPDFRGHGKSGWCKEPYSINNYAKDIIELIEQEIKEPVAIFGHSLGGMVAMMIASKIPPLVKCVINGDASFDKEHIAKWSKPTADVAEIINKSIQSSKTKFEQFQKFLQAPVKPPISDEMIPTIEHPLAEVGLIAFSSKSCMTRDPRVIAETKDALKMMEEYNPDEFLPKITCPVLLLRGDPQKNALMTDDDITIAKKYLKDLAYIRYEGIGHNLYFEDLPLVIRHILNYLIFISE